MGTRKVNLKNIQYMKNTDDATSKGIGQLLRWYLETQEHLVLYLLYIMIGESLSLYKSKKKL